MKTLIGSIILAVLTEALLVILALTIGKMGPCGPTNDIAGIVFAIHAPGFLIASALHLPGDFFAMSFSILTVLLGFTMLYLALLVALKFFWSRPKTSNPGLPTPK